MGTGAGRGAPRPTGGLPRKPSVAQVTAAQAAPNADRGRGQGIGVGRGAGMNIRGTAAHAPGAPGVSIIGAAGKRAREEPNAADGSLAKRLKPAEGATAPKPVTIQRNRQQPPPS